MLSSNSLLIVSSLLLAAVPLAVATGHAQCSYELAESMPDGLDDLPRPAGTSIRATHEALIGMVEGARRTVRIASFYLALTPEGGATGHPSERPGLELMEAIVGAAKRGVDVEVIVDRSNKRDMSNRVDVEKLIASGGRIRELNMKKLLGGGVLHSKFMIVDNQTLYVGSSNFDWRSYTQVKEIGIVMTGCPLLAQDLDRIYRTYALMSESDFPPRELTEDLKALTNLSRPFLIDDVKLTLAGSPPAFNAANTGRTDDIDGLLQVLNAAKKTIDISVMNYSPLAEFSFPKKYWPVIDNALRRAATERNVRVRLLFSKWSHSREIETAWYKSLNALHTPKLRGGIHVKMFEVPAFDEFQSKLPYSRVKHDKYMVTDGALYIGTSNWAPDYFRSTCGVGVVIEPANHPVRGSDWIPPQIVETMKRLFERDFNSRYASELE